MGVRIRPASLQDGIAVLSLLEGVGYYPEPIGFAETYRRTLHDRNFLVRIAESEDGRIVGMASLAMRYQLGVGGIVASLDELAILPGPHAKSADRKLRRETVGQARKLGAVRIVQHANEGTPSPRPAAARALVPTTAAA